MVLLRRLGGPMFALNIQVLIFCAILAFSLTGYGIWQLQIAEDDHRMQSRGVFTFAVGIALVLLLVALLAIYAAPLPKPLPPPGPPPTSRAP